MFGKINQGVQIRTYLIVVLAVLATVTPAAADNAAQFYRGKTLKLVVGFGAGGGYDAYARLIAPALEARTGATVVVLNKPGGGGNVALNQVAAETADGLTMMLINGPSTVLSQLLGTEGVRFDLLKLTWLAGVMSEERVMLVNAESALRSLDDLRKADEIKWATSGGASLMGVAPAFISEALSLNSRIIAGYKGSKEAALSSSCRRTPDSCDSWTFPSRSKAACARRSSCRSRVCLPGPWTKSAGTCPRRRNR